ncbi:MAG: DUF4157 domain-containing protein [Taibaiella sp.]|jgi:hypothetical protein
MRNLRSLIIIAIALFSNSNIYAGINMQFAFAGSTVELLDSAGAASENARSDAYTKALTPFDLQIRLGIVNGATEKDYLIRSASQVRNWPEDEQQQLKKSFSEIEAFLKVNKIKLNLPTKIQLIKTAGKEEFGAEGYTRGNHIMLCTGPRQEITTHLVAHELFHVHSRFNEKKRDEIYKIFGFEKCNRINTAVAMKNKMITNPDCPFIEHYITLDVDGKPKDMVLQLYSKKEYNKDYTLGDYMNLGLLQVEGNAGQKKPVMKNGAGVVYELDQVPDLFKHIGSNTSYILHPEEISAEHFAMWVINQEVPQPEFMEKLKAVLQ